MNIPSYIDVITKYYPSLQVRANGNAYEDLIVLAESAIAIPSKEELDTKVKEDIIAQQWESIKTERDRRSQTGGYKVGNYWYHSDQPSRTQQIALVVIGAGLPTGLMWKTMSGEFVNMTQTLAQQVFGTAVQSDQAIFAKAEYHRAQMTTSANPESYDFMVGWPLTFEESLIT